jgi:hypothetical protein
MYNSLNVVVGLVAEYKPIWPAAKEDATGGIDPFDGRYTQLKPDVELRDALDVLGFPAMDPKALKFP